MYYIYSRPILVKIEYFSDFHVDQHYVLKFGFSLIKHNKQQQIKQTNRVIDSVAGVLIMI